MNITGKKISIIGAVRSGLGAAKLAKKLGAKPFVSDSSDKEKLSDAVMVLESENIEYEIGLHSEKVYECDFIITSPGVPSNSAVLTNALNKGIKIISELEFASWFCNGKILAITGTNGKTTTTSLCAYTLNKAGYKCYEAGNIGLAFSEIVLNIKEDEYVALETSSFQLDYVDSFSPFISVILNITPDHLDRYENSVAKYAASKLNIAKNQNIYQYYVCNFNDSEIPALSNEAVNKFHFSLTENLANGAFIKNGRFMFSNNYVVEDVCSLETLSIKGSHNQQNALAVLAIAKIVGCSNESIADAFTKFPGVEHRLEFVRELNGIEYINDSKATNVDSVWYALQSFDKPIYLILGGKDKGNDYNRIKELVIKHVLKIFAIGSSADKINDFFNAVVPVEIKKDLRDCVLSAHKEAQPNTILLLSPACASFDMFENYEHRGKVFKEEIMKMK
ncbi:MAG: UDP-N-acetylmuramoyl-L-alanine--D-glutamate ligase [Ignavibacteriae bacterium HGW-Ignavibacteriae-2]|jgi:UDP-N-acetylmuramoylalanine--D-glutamate ligase|nr:MAG: UDP-N-acetylmuramoyl-L-alanine--D-glutamate ligase [Ignavibacteriae bacterium HGW-Ignavibacteriae-2]